MPLPSRLRFSNSFRFQQDPILLDYTTPAEAIGRPLDAAHADAVIFRIAARVAGDDDVIAGLQGVAGDAFTAQLAAAAPFHRPSFHVALVVGGFDVDERMRIAEHELDQSAFDRDVLVFK